MVLVPSSGVHVRHVIRPPWSYPDGAGPLAASGRPLRWGIVGTGLIARRVTPQLLMLGDAVLQAVSSRDAARAGAFADEFGARAAYGGADDEPGYARLAADPDVDVAYVATPHGQHHAVTRALLEAGKHVLVEKAFTVTGDEAEDLIQLARSRGLFLMEAVWTRFLPVYQAVADAVAAGELGRVRWVQADLGFAAPFDPGSRMWAPEDGGGALLDLGVYAYAWAFAGLGRPRSVVARGHVNELGVDGLAAVTLEYGGGGFAQLTMTLVSQATRTATIAGSDATLRTWAPLTQPGGFSIDRAGRSRDVRSDAGVAPYAHMLREVTRCIQQGLTESPTMSLDDTLATMRLFDEARRQMGVRYPNDER